MTQAVPDGVLTRWSSPITTEGHEIETPLRWNSALALPEIILTSSPTASAKSSLSGSISMPVKRLTIDTAASAGMLSTIVPTISPETPMMPETSCVAFLSVLMLGSPIETGS